MTQVTIKFGKKAGTKTPKFGVSWSGQVVVDTTDYLLNGKPIPAASLPYIIVNGIKQSLADSYAGAADAAETEGAFSKRLEKIMTGQPPKAGGRETDPLVREVNRLVKAELETIAKAKGKKLPSGEELAKLLEARKVKHKDRLEAEAQANLDKIAAQAEDDDFLDDFEPEEQEDEEEQEEQA